MSSRFQGLNSPWVASACRSRSCAKWTRGYLLIPIEGKDAPRINGAAVAPEGAPLHPGDTFEVAGVRLELTADI